MRIEYTSMSLEMALVFCFNWLNGVKYKYSEIKIIFYRDIEKGNREEEISPHKEDRQQTLLLFTCFSMSKLCSMFSQSNRKVGKIGLDIDFTSFAILIFP